MKPAEGSTVIGKSVVIRGELSGNEDLYIDGDVEGTITLAGEPSDHRSKRAGSSRYQRSRIVVFGNSPETFKLQAASICVSRPVKGDILAGRLSIEESAVSTGRVELKGELSRSRQSLRSCRRRCSAG